MNNLTIEQVNDIAEFIDLELGIEVRPYEGYSGRGMFGREVNGFSLDTPSHVAAIGYAAGALEVPFEDLPTRTDSLGLGIILY